MIDDKAKEQDMHKYIQIAVDGPGSAGKSTLAKGAAARLGETVDCVYVDTGALYRAIGLYMTRAGIDPGDRDAVVPELPNVSLSLEYREGAQTVSLNGEDVSGLIRTPEISSAASKVSAIPEVRAFLLDTQRSIADSVSVVMDGRDIGTVILPDADVKVFLTATAEQRAKRRYKELTEKGQDVDYETVYSDLVARDKADETRAAAPLRAADDAIPFDNSEVGIEEGIDWLVGRVTERCAEKLEKLKRT